MNAAENKKKDSSGFSRKAEYLQAPLVALEQMRRWRWDEDGIWQVFWESHHQSTPGTCNLKRCCSVYRARDYSYQCVLSGPLAKIAELIGSEGLWWSRPDAMRSRMLSSQRHCRIHTRPTGIAISRSEFATPTIKSQAPENMNKVGRWWFTNIEEC